MQRDRAAGLCGSDRVMGPHHLTGKPDRAPHCGRESLTPKRTQHFADYGLAHGAPQWTSAEGLLLHCFQAFCQHIGGPGEVWERTHLKGGIYITGELSDGLP